MLCGPSWRSEIKKHYGASMCSKWYQLAADVHCVAVGLKPAYLLDTLPPDPALLCSLLDHVLSDHEQLQSGQQIRGVPHVVEWQEELRVVSIGSDVLVINRTALQNLFQDSPCVYVDVSRSERERCTATADSHIHIQHSSEVEDQCRQWYSEFCAAEKALTGSTSSAGVRLLHVALSPDVNVCTLFGRLLGYPVVYWFNTTAEYSLDLVELVNYKVTVSSTGQDDCNQETYTSLRVRCLANSNRLSVITKAWDTCMRIQCFTIMCMYT